MPEKNKTNDFDDKLVQMSNVLARKISGNTSNENKLLMMTISQLDPYDINSNIVKLKKKDVFEKLGLTGNNRYKDVKKWLRKLTKSSFVDLTKDNIKGDFEGIAGYVLPSFETNYKSDFYEIEVSTKFLPHMKILKSYYTTMELDTIVAFNSIFSHRLYQYICSWQDRGESYLTTEELKEIFNLGKEDYVRENGWFDRYLFEKYTLDVAIEEIKKFSEFKVNYKKIKKSGRIRYYKLTWHRIDEIEERQTTFEEFGDENIDWNKLYEEHSNLFVSAIKQVYEEVINGPDKNTYNINGNRLNGKEVKKEYKELTTADIIPILEELDITPNIKNTRNWITSALYNARLNSMYKDQKELEKSVPDFKKIDRELEEFLKR